MITAEELSAILLTGTKGINVSIFQARPNIIRSAPIAASSRYVVFGSERNHLKQHSVRLRNVDFCVTRVEFLYQPRRIGHHWETIRFHLASGDGPFKNCTDRRRILELGIAMRPRHEDAKRYCCVV